MQLTYTQHAWIDPRFTTIEDIKQERTKPALSSCAPGENGYFEREGYAYIGTAHVTVDVNSPDQIVMDQIKGLNAQLETVRAEAQQKENAILLQISKLQALTMG